MPTARRLFRSPLLAIADVTCEGGDTAGAEGERAAAFEVVLPRRGVFIRHTARGEEIGDPNRVLFFNRDEPYRVTHPAGGGDACTVIALPSDLLPDLAGSDRFPAGGAALGVAEDLRHRRLLAALAMGTCSALAVEEGTLGLLRRVTAAACRRSAGRGRAARAAAAARHRRLAESARVILAARFRERVSLAGLSRSLGCSPFHLCRVFRGLTGLTLHRYQLRLRLREALERLSGGERDLTQLALHLGFADHSHFANAFRQELGMSPSAWRRATSKILQARDGSGR